MPADIDPHLARAGLGFLLGVAFGFIARRGRFCTLGAIEDAVYGADTARLRSWALAIAVAIAGTQLLGALTSFDPAQSIYTAPRLDWAGAILGGLMFGLGMALVGTCGLGTLLRLGGGDMKALLAFLVIAVTAGMALRGVTGLLRVRLIDPLALDLSAYGSQEIGSLLGLSRPARLALAAAIAAGLAAFALSGRSLRRSPRLIATGLGIGGLIVAGWWVTAIVGGNEFDLPKLPQSFSFVTPIGDSLVYAMFTSGMRIDFPVATVAGVLFGAFLAARLAGEFQWEGPDDVREVKRHLLGAFLMGSGGVIALGCTIGQGISGLSTLAVGSVLATGAIFCGARAGLYWLVERG